MKKISFYILVSFFLFCLSSKTFGFQVDISKKYNNIFSSKIFSEEDVHYYQQAYLFQEKCKWKSANKHLLKISNKILVGHILAQRYLHPDCYRSKYLELYYWLKKYNDLPQAKRIYRLAVKRMPKGYKSPNQPIKVKGITEKAIQTKKKPGLAQWTWIGTRSKARVYVFLTLP